MKGNLFEKLENYANSDFYPFHMPGHKRNTDPASDPITNAYRYDITEIDGFDNLHQPEGIIAAMQKDAAQLYQAEETYYLINGSTAGILSAISAVSEKGGKLLISRNCHKSVYHAAFLNHLDLEYIYPDILEEFDIAAGVKPEDIDRKIQEIISKAADEKGKRIAAVVITSPTYDGISSDVETIAKITHAYGIPLIVDQAHGAHFGFHPAYPESAVKQGADMVIHSVHKTLAAPTQTAILHRNGKLTDPEKLRKYLRIYQSSSPSYLLMAGIEEALCMMKKEGYERLDKLAGFSNRIKNEAAKLQYIKICPETEPGKLIISVKGTPLTGQQLYDILREKYHLQMEMASGSYVTAILSIMDREEGIERLILALKEIDWELENLQAECNSKSMRKCAFTMNETMAFLKKQPKKRMNLWEAYTACNREISLQEIICPTEISLTEAGSKNTTGFWENVQEYIAAEFINLYPPGIPLLVPGEVLDRQMADLILQYMKNGYNVQGIEDNKIKVVYLPQ